MSQGRKKPSDIIKEISVEPTVGIITALPKEYAAVKALLDSPAPYHVQGRGAGRRYLLGKIPSFDGGEHFVVLVLADMGNNIAANRATLLLEHFPTVNSIIMTGIAGGIPNPTKPDEHVRLGDIVVSDRHGVVQYDFDKETINETIHRHSPRPPGAALLEGVRLLEADALGEDVNKSWITIVDRALQRLRLARPPASTDILVSSTDPNALLEHPVDPHRIGERSRIFTGPIASANKLLKNPIKRDQLRDMFGVKAVEMEGSGVADASWNAEVGYLVIRGICDYCDANKGDAWQKYAAVVAAAYTRALLESMPSQNPLLYRNLSEINISSETSVQSHTNNIRHNLLPKGGIFVGRQTYKRKVLNALFSTWPVVIISGIGGIGKTVLALECAHLILQSSNEMHQDISSKVGFENIIWISARERDINLDDVLDNIARVIQQGHITRLSAEAKLVEILNYLTSSITLIIIDNYEGAIDRDIDLFLRQIVLPNRVLITSRKRLWQFENSQNIPLRKLPDSEAIALIKLEAERLGSIDTHVIHNKKIGQLISTTGGLPLAIKLSVGLAIEKGQSVEEIITSIKKGEGEIFQILFRRMWRSLGMSGHSMLMSASIFAAPPDRVALSAGSGLNPSVVNKTVSTLLDLSLLEPLNLMGEESVRFSMHPLIRHFATSKLSVDQKFYRSALQRMANYYIKLSSRLPKDHDWNDDSLVLTLPHEDIQIMVSLIDKLWEAKKWRKLLALRNNIWFFLTIKGYWKDRIHIDELAILAAERIGDKTVKPWIYVQTFSFLAFKHGDIDLSADYCEKALQIFVEFGDADGIAFCNIRLGMVAIEQRNFSKAEKLLKKALQHVKAVNDQDRMIWISGILGNVYCGMGDYKRGQAHYLFGLKLAQKLGWQVRIGQMHYKLAYTSIQDGDFKQAAYHFLECINILENSEGSHIDVYSRAKLGLTIALYRQGDVHSAKKQFGEAKKLLSDLEIDEEYIKSSLEELNIAFNEPYQNG